MPRPKTKPKAKLKPFVVRLTRDTTESCDLVVMAKDVIDAETNACIISGKYGENIGPWVPDDCTCGERYIPDPRRNAEELTTPYCVLKYRRRPPLYAQLAWKPRIYTVGTRGDWHGFWVVGDIDDDLAAEIITHNSVDGDRTGKAKGARGAFTWEIVGDPSKGPEDD